MNNRYKNDEELRKKYLSMPAEDIKTGEDSFFWWYYNCNGGWCDMLHVYYHGEHYFIFDESCIMRLDKTEKVENGEILFETDEEDLDSIMDARCFPGDKTLMDLIKELPPNDVYGC